jgi:hypothetical protein
VPASPRSLLRLEGALVLFAAAGAYAATGLSWWLFAGLLLVPDVAMLGYGAGPRVGAAVYNAAHTYAGPLLLGGAALGLGHTLLGGVALIWVAHVGMDRALGYGLKHPTGFHDTHLSGPARPRDTEARRPGVPGRAGSPEAARRPVPERAPVPPNGEEARP